MGGDGHFQFTSESIFNDQEYTDSPPDKDNPDFDHHDARTPVPTIVAPSINQALTIRRLPTHRPIDALNLDDSAGSSSSVLDLDIEKLQHLRQWYHILPTTIALMPIITPLIM